MTTYRITLLEQPQRTVREIDGALIATKGTTATAIATQFAAAVADEYQLYLLFKTGRVVDIIHGDGAAAEETDVGEPIEIPQGNRLGFHSAHGQARHGAMRLVGERTEVGIDVGDQLVDENRLEGADVEVSEATEPDFVGHAVGHYDEERPDFPFGDQVVHDQVGMALVAPGGFILAPAVLQVQHRISPAQVLVIFGWCVDESSTGRVCAF